MFSEIIGMKTIVCQYEKKKFNLHQQFFGTIVTHILNEIMSRLFLISCLLSKTFDNLTFENLLASYSCIKAIYWHNAMCRNSQNQVLKID